MYGEGKGRIYLYEGGWKRGIPNGFGIETIVNVLIYKGFFVDGKKSGQGVLKYADGSQFEGSFEGNRIEGTGVYKTNGHQWKGTWKNGYL